MLWRTVSETTIKPENGIEDSRSEIDNEVDGNNDRSLCKSVEARKDTFFEKKFLTFEARLAFT